MEGKLTNLLIFSVAAVITIIVIVGITFVLPPTPEKEIVLPGEKAFNIQALITPPETPAPSGYDIVAEPDFVPDHY
jgi:hypothetical protein